MLHKGLTLDKRNVFFFFLTKGISRQTIQLTTKLDKKLDSGDDFAYSAQLTGWFSN